MTGVSGGLSRRSAEWSFRGVGLFGAIALVGVVALALVVLFTIWTTPDRTLGDLALIELEVRRTLSFDPPLSGAYSRFGWRHPGPMFLYLLAIPYFALGAGAHALNTGALVLNVGWSLWSVVVVGRRGRAASVAFSSCLLLMIGGLGADGIGYAWNVSLTLVPFVAVVIGCWGVLCGDRAAGALAALAYVFVIQTHVGAGVVVTPLAIVTLTAVLLSPELRNLHRLTRRSAIPIVAVVVAVLPVVIDVVLGPPGNSGRLLRWAVSNDQDVIGFSEAARMLARTSSLSFPVASEQPRFLLWAETGSVGVAPGFFFALVCVFGIIAVRRGRREEATLSGVLVVAWVSGFLGARSVLAPPEWWQVEWLQPLGWMTIAGVAVLCWRLVFHPALSLPPPRPEVVASGLLCLAIAVAVISQVRSLAELDERTAEAVEPVERLADAVEDTAERRGVRIDIVVPDFAAENMLAGLVNESVHRNVDVCVGDSFDYKFPSSLICSDTERPVVLLRTEPIAQPGPPGYTTLVTYDPLSPRERADVDAIRERVSRALETDGRKELIPTLDTPLAADAILDRPGPAIDELRQDIEWLDTIREKPGLRFGLYRQID